MIANWRNNLRKIKPYVPGEQSEKRDIVKLNANENPYPPSPMALEALKSLDFSSLRLYPQASSYKLKFAIAQKHGVDTDMVFVGNGSDEVLAMCFMAFFNSDKPVLFPDITYSFYPVWCELYNTPFRTVPLDESFRMNPDDYTGEKGGVIIPNPNAPTGFAEDRDFIEKILELSRDCIVIIDEAYVDFSDYSCVELLEKYENLVVVQTFSKSRSLAGLRLGYAIAGRELAGALEAVKNSYNSYTIDSIALELGAASILDGGYFEDTVGKIKNTRARAEKRLESMGFKVFPSSANFIFVTGDKLNARELFEYLREKSVFIRYFNLPRIDNHLRITVGTDEEMEVLFKYIELYKKERNIDVFN